MFRRVFWFGAGAAAGVWATTKVNRKIRSLAPDSLALRAADRAVEGGRRAREFALEVRSGMVQREHELQDALGLGDGQDVPAGPDGPAADRDGRDRRPPEVPGQRGGRVIRGRLLPEPAPRGELDRARRSTDGRA